MLRVAMLRVAMLRVAMLRVAMLREFGYCNTVPPPTAATRNPQPATRFSPLGTRNQAKKCPVRNSRAGH
jgi:hypothetical protein